MATVVGLIVTILQTNGALNEARRGNRLNLLFERRSRREARLAAQEQKRALEIAESNAAAATGQLDLARRLSVRQFRPHMGVSLDLTAEFDDSDTIVRLISIPVYTNISSNIAKKVIWYGSLGVRGDPLPANAIIDEVEFSIPVDMAPGETGKGTIQSVTKDEVNGLIAGTHFVYLWTRAMYTMADSEEWFSTRAMFQLVHDPDRPGNVPFSWQRFGDEANVMD